MTRQVNFGLWYDFRNPQQAPFERFYAQSLEQITWAESLGFDSVWLTEHHFVEDGYTPSPLVIAGAIGQATSRMRIGTNLMLLPIADPIRLAEDAATLSLLTGGRFDLGVGLGYRELEFNYFGRSLKNRPSLMEEGVSIIRQAWSGEPVNFSGKRFEVNNLLVRPVPESVPRLLMGGMSEPAITRAAEMADGFLSTGGIGHDIYRDALDWSGKTGAIYAGNWSIVAEDPEAELAKVGDHVLYQTNEYIRWGAFGPPDEVPLFETPQDAVEGGLYELMDGNAAIENLTSLVNDNPEIVDVHFWAQFPGESFESGSARMEYLATKVLPEVRKNIT